MILYLEIIAFSFLCTLIKSYIPNEQIILVMLCLFGYIIVFRDYHKERKKQQIRSF